MAKTSTREELFGKCAWITGASSGIGLAIAKKLYDRVETLALSSRDKNTLIERAHQFSQNGSSKRPIFTVRCDVRFRESILAAHERIAVMYENTMGVAEIGIPDILVNNAGAGYFAKAWEYTDEQIAEMLEANLAGLINCTRAVLPGMMLCGRGVIVNILSVASVKTFTNCSVYAATKAGALAFSRSLREEVRPYNIKVIDILAGATETPLWTEESRTEFSERMMQPADIAEAVGSAIELARRERVSVEEILIRPRLGDL